MDITYCYATDIPPIENNAVGVEIVDFYVTGI